MAPLRRSPRNHLSTHLQDIKHLRRSPRGHKITKASRRPSRKALPTPPKIVKPSIAAPRVVALPELLEHILLQTIRNKPTEIAKAFSVFDELGNIRDIRALFRLQRVNKAFKATIEGSRICRRAMFPEHSHNGSDRDLLQVNPLIFDMSPIEASIKGEIETFYGYEPGEGGPVKGLRYNCWYNDKHDSYLSLFPRHGQKILTESLSGLHAKTTQSWERTLVCNMPISIYFNFKVEYKDGCRKCTRKEYCWKSMAHLVGKDDTLSWLMSTLVDELEGRAGYRKAKALQS